VTRKKNDVENVLDMLVHIADENVQSRRVSTQAKGLTAADIERMEWQSFEAKMKRRAEVLGADLLAECDDDGDSLMLVLLALSAHKGPMTTWEVMRDLQRQRLLSHAFPAAARAHTTVLLNKLRVANKVWQDTYGRWALL
jgi:hypothetical protein